LERGTPSTRRHRRPELSLFLGKRRTSKRASGVISSRAWTVAFPAVPSRGERIRQSIAAVVSLERDKIDSRKLPRSSRRYRELRRVPRAREQSGYTCKPSLSLSLASSGYQLLIDSARGWSWPRLRCNPTPDEGYPVSRGFPSPRWLAGDATLRRRCVVAASSARGERREVAGARRRGKETPLPRDAEASRSAPISFPLHFSLPSPRWSRVEFHPVRERCETGARKGSRDK